MKKVLLVNTNREMRPYPVPPLGLCLVASCVEQDYEVRIYDSMFSGTDAASAVRTFRPDYIGMGIRNIDDVNCIGTQYYIDAILEDFVVPVKAVSDCPLILGGSGFSLFPEELMALTKADYGVVGEGEDAFPAILDCLERGTDPLSIRGVVGANSSRGRVRPRPMRPRAFPFSEIDKKLDFSPYRERGAYPVQTKRGCGHHCLYCTYPGIEGRDCRLRDPRSVVDEIEEASGRLGEVTFEFVDSTFNDPPGHAEDICHEIVRRGLRPRLRTMGINPAGASGELFDLMRTAGFAQIDCTPDSASPRVLERLRKNFILPDLIKAARMIREKDMPTMWFFIFGGPGENRDTFRETMDFIDKWVNPQDMVYMTLGLRIYPRTGLYDLALQEKIITPSANLLRPVFYLSPQMPEEELLSSIREVSATRPNCIPIFEAAPPPEMLREAMGIRKAGNLTEPMFRTLLKIRARQFRGPSGTEDRPS